MTGEVSTFSYDITSTIISGGRGSKRTPEVIFLPGNGLRSANYLPFLNEFSESTGANIHALDYSGGVFLSVSDIAEDVVGYVRQNDLGGPVVMGHSLGSIIAMEVDNQMGGVRSIHFNPAIGPHGDIVSHYTFARQWRLAYSMMAELFDPFLVSKRLQRGTLPSIQAGLDIMLRGAEACSSIFGCYAHQPRELRGDALIIRSTGDPIAYHTEAQLSSVVGSSAQIITVPGSDHLIPINRPNHSLKLANRFVN